MGAARDAVSATPRLAAMKIEGLAAPTNVWTWHERERQWSQFAPGAFAQACAHGRARLIVHHRLDRILATQDAGTLRLYETAEGLMFEADVAPSPLATFVEHAI